MIFFKNIEDQDTELYKTFIVKFDKEYIKTKYVKMDQTLLLDQKHQHQKKYWCTNIKVIYLRCQEQLEKQVEV